MAFPVEQTHIDCRLVTRSGLMLRVLTDFHLLWLLFSFFNINNFFFLGGWVGWGDEGDEEGRLSYTVSIEYT